MNQTAFHHADVMEYQAGTNAKTRAALRRTQRKSTRRLPRVTPT